jgi:hypothetical protein
VLREIAADRFTDAEALPRLRVTFSTAQRLDLVDLRVEPVAGLCLRCKPALPSSDSVLINESDTPALGKLFDTASLLSRHRQCVPIESGPREWIAG